MFIRSRRGALRYSFLKSPETVTHLRKATLKLIKFAERKKTRTIVALDKSGRLAGLLFYYTLKELHPTKKPPELFFLQPEKIASRALWFSNFLKNIRWLGGIGFVKKWSESTKQRMLEKLRTQSPYLARVVGRKPILLLDEYAHSGYTLSKSKKALEILGARVFSSALCGDPKTIIFQPDFIGILKRETVDWKYLEVSGVKRGKGLLAKPAADVKEMKRAVLFREELKTLAKKIARKSRA